jgi:hypothetical protein
MARKTNQDRGRGGGEKQGRKKGDVDARLVDPATEEAEANRAHTGTDFPNYPDAAQENEPSPTERTGGEPPA